jgi:hypothetical protein
MYGEMSVIAAVPAALEGGAKKWFAAHRMPRERMRSIDGWIEALTDEFKVNTAMAREKSMLRRYNPSKDESVDDYYYAKLELVRAGEAGMSRRRTVEELWLGLPADFQALLDYERMMEETVPNFGRILRTKDLSYRSMTSRKLEESRSFRERERYDGIGKDEKKERRSGGRDYRRSRERRRYDRATEEYNDKKEDRGSRGFDKYDKRDKKGEKRKEDLPPQL